MTTGVYSMTGGVPTGTPGVYSLNGGTEVSPGVYSFQVGPLTGYPDAPTPYVVASFDNLATGTQTVTVSRTAAGRTMRVRGGVNLFAVGGAQVVDYEVPNGIPATYQAEQFDAAGVSLGMTPANTIDIGWAGTVVHQPLSPALSVRPRVFLDTAADQVSPTPGATVWPEGATVGRTIGGQRTGLQGTKVRLRFNSAADADVFASMFGSYSTDFPPVLCIRTPPNVPLPPVLFASCLDPHRVQYGNGALITYEMTMDEVAPPAPGLIIPLLRREDIDAAYPTRAARAAAYSTRLARDTDYSLAGLAG